MPIYKAPVISARLIRNTQGQVVFVVREEDDSDMEGSEGETESVQSQDANLSWRKLPYNLLQNEKKRCLNSLWNKNKELIYYYLYKNLFRC